MEDRIRWPEASRREFLWSSSMLVGASVIATGLLDVAAAIAAGEIKDVARNRTLVTVRGGTDGKHTEHELWSPYVIGSNPQLGGNIIYEPLAFYSAFADKEILWLAESYGYNDDYTELTVKTRSGIAWSDGKPFSAEDVAYSLNTLNELGAKVKWGKDVQEVLDQATVVDPNTTLIKFKVPAPRFFNHMLSYKYDIGLHIVPKHIFEGQDWTTFAAYDLEKGWPVTTGPWKVVNASPTQKVFDRRDSWWGVEAGVGKLPEVERIVLLPDAGEQQLAQGLISNAVDFSTGLQVATFPTVFAGNPNITTFTGKELPWGNVDWWPTSLYLNCERAPFNDPKFRWAISYLIDRQVLIDVGWGGASSLSPLPMPDGSVYKGLEPYFELAAPLLARYPTNAFDPDKGAELLDELGWKKGGDGLYQDPGRQPVHARDHQFLRFPVGRTGAGRAVATPGRQRHLRAAAGHVRPLLLRRLQRRDLRPRRQCQRSLRDAAPLPVVRVAAARRTGAAPGQPRALEQQGIRPDRRRDVQDAADRDGEDAGAVAQGDGNLAAGAARRPAHAILPSSADEPDLLEELPDGKKPLRQSGLLPFDLRARAAQPRSGIVDPTRRNVPNARGV